MLQSIPRELTWLEFVSWLLQNIATFSIPSFLWPMCRRWGPRALWFGGLSFRRLGRRAHDIAVRQSEMPLSINLVHCTRHAALLKSNSFYGGSAAASTAWLMQSRLPIPRCPLSQHHLGFLPHPVQLLLIRLPHAPCTPPCAVHKVGGERNSTTHYHHLGHPPEFSAECDAEFSAEFID